MGSTKGQTILLVEDIRFLLTEFKREWEDAGHKVIGKHNLPDALKAFEENKSKVSCAILDLKLPLTVAEDGPVSSELAQDTSGGYLAGWYLARKIIQGKPSVKVIGYSGGPFPEEVSKWFNRYGSGVWDKSRDLIPGKLAWLLDKTISGKQRKITSFIVHGHNDSATYELKDYLQNTLKLDEPTILHEQPQLGRTIIEKFEDHASKADVVFVMLTPDDMVKTLKTNDEKRRARQNVIFEMGYFMGLFGRQKGRVILLHEKPLELPTDIHGLVYIDISNGLEASGEKIRKELKALGIMTP